MEKKIESKIYTILFQQNIMLRQSCGKCFFTNFKRPSDLTIGDYWGWKKISDNFNADNKGCSLVFINTKKGYEIFLVISKFMHLIHANMNLCIQPNLIKPSIVNPKTKHFVYIYKNKGLKSLILRCKIDAYKIKFINRIKSFSRIK